MGANILASFTEIGNNFICSIPGELDQNLLYDFSDSILKKSQMRKFNGAIFDFSAVRILDSYEYKSYHNTSKALGLMGIQVIWTSLSATLVAAMMDLGLDLDNKSIKTAINLEEGLRMLGNTI